MIEHVLTKTAFAPVVGCHQNTSLAKLCKKVLPLQQRTPPGFLQVTGEQNLESCKADEHDQAEVVRVREGRVRVPEHGGRNTAHIQVEWLANRLIERGTRCDIAFCISSEWPALALDLSHLLACIARISIHHRNGDSGIPQALQVTHVILIGIRDEQVVEIRASKVAPDVVAGTPIDGAARIDHCQFAAVLARDVLHHSARAVLHIPHSQNHLAL